jgi:hypothetical protein
VFGFSSNRRRSPAIYLVLFSRTNLRRHQSRWNSRSEFRRRLFRLPSWKN